MARDIDKLKALDVARAKPKIGADGKPRGHYLSDGLGLYLQVTKEGARSWVFRYQWTGRRREYGLGSAHDVTLAQARQMVPRLRQLVRDGVDPIARRKTARAPAAALVTFRDAAEAYITAHEKEWRSLKHGQAWRQTLEAYAYPIIGDMPVAQVDTAAVLKVLAPIWATRTVTASRVRNRLELVLDAAAAAGHRSGDNPARWQGGLKALLAAPTKLAKVAHYAAVPWRELPALYARLTAETSIAAYGLRFTILTAARTGMVRLTTWSEIARAAALWTIPAVRMKREREHRVPLSAPAMEIIARMSEWRTSNYVFPGRRDRPMGINTMLDYLHRLGVQETQHGFRSCFSDWCAETGKPLDLRDAALAHSVGSTTTAAYQRGDLLDRRKVLMADWAAFLAGLSAVGIEDFLG